MYDRSGCMLIIILVLLLLQREILLNLLKGVRKFCFWPKQLINCLTILMMISSINHEKFIVQKPMTTIRENVLYSSGWKRKSSICEWYFSESHRYYCGVYVR